MPHAPRSDAPGLHYRNAIADLDAVPFRTVITGSDRTEPLVTFAITVFKRFRYLPEAVRSVLDQQFDRPVEIIVVDDDPDSTLADQLLDAMPELREKNFRYLVTGRNMGVNGTFNRGIKEARGKWVSILNDDDLLAPDLLSTIFKVLDADPSIKAITSRKAEFDERQAGALKPRTGLRGIASRLLVDSNFGSSGIRRLTVKKLFWGPLAGNCAGFIFDREAALAIGGYYPEEEVSADYIFFIRFAQRFGLWQHKAVLAHIRIAENESAKPATLQAFIRQSRRVQTLLAEADVPRWWGRLSPLMIARQRGEYLQMWHVDIPKDWIERELAMRLPRDHPILYRAIRLAFRGF